MNTPREPKRPSQNYPAYLAMPWQQIRRFLLFWHIIYLGMLAVSLTYALWQARASMGQREVWLVVMVLVQAVIYAKTFIFYDRAPVAYHGWPLPRWWMVGYYAVSLMLWFIEARWEPNFFWVVWAYIGQMYATLPPIVFLPVTTVLYLVALVNGEGIRLVGMMNVFQIFGLLLPVISFGVLGAYISSLWNASTDRGRLIAELQAAQKELEAARQRDAELAVLRERERLARDLHDTLGHALVALSIQLEAIQRLYRVDPARASEQVDEMKTLTRSSMETLRRSLDGLRAPGLGSRSLSSALQTLAVDTTQRARIEVTCHVDPGADSLASPAAETVWNIALEALTNVEKHAQARHAEIHLSISADAATLCVSDDGIGLAGDDGNQPGHYGLIGMRERVEGLGGTITAGRSGQGGAVIQAQIPIG